MNSTASTKAMPGSFFPKISTTLLKRLPKIWFTAQVYIVKKYIPKWPKQFSKHYFNLHIERLPFTKWKILDSGRCSVYLEYVSKWSDIFWRCCQIWLPLNNDFELWIEETPVSVTREYFNKQDLEKGKNERRHQWKLRKDGFKEDTGQSSTKPYKTQIHTLFRFDIKSINT